MGGDDQEQLIERFMKERQRLYEILDRDPEEAVAEAIRLKPSDEIEQLNVDLIRASIFVDGGIELRDNRLIEDGVSIFRRARTEMPERLDLAYNLANGLTALAETTDPGDQPWLLVTSDLRREARSLFASTSKVDDVRGLRSQVYTNLGNLLSQAFRWVEAYDAYSAALRLDSENGVASSGMAKLLLGCIDRGIGDPEWLNSLAAKYIRLARNSGARTKEYGGQRAIRVVEALDPGDYSDPEMPDLSGASEYARFIARYGLAISLTLEGLDPVARSWDTLVIGSIRETADAEFGVPPIFAMWNVLKADFLAARWAAFIASSGGVPETGSYSDTLDYAKYGVSQSFWMLAQRAAIDILDRVAVAASEYLQLSGSSRSIYFWKRWHVMDGRRLRQPRQWIPEIEAEIDRGNTALIALSELADDISKDGFLHPKKSLRNSSTHRFVVLHDMGNDARSSRHVEHYDQDEFESQTLQSLQLVRSALLYFIEMVAFREAQYEPEGGFVGSLLVPSHHSIRGEDD